MRLKVSSAKWRPFCLRLNVLKIFGMLHFIRNSFINQLVSAEPVLDFFLYFSPIMHTTKESNYYIGLYEVVRRGIKVNVQQAPKN